MARGRKPAHIANPGLRAARVGRGWTEEDAAIGLQRLSADLGEPEPAVSESQISKWERGVRQPGKFYRPRLCLLFELPPQSIGLPANPRLLRDIEELSRRLLERRKPLSASQAPPNVLHRPELAVPPSAFPHLDAERLAAVMHYLWPVDSPLLDGLERASRYLDQRADLEAPNAIVPDLLAFLGGVQHLLTRPQGTAGPMLKTIAARAAHQVGYLSFVDGQSAPAFNHFAISEVLAREAGNYLELATTLVGKSGFYLPGDMDTAIQVTHGASLLLSSQAPSGLTAWIWGERAMQEAELGHEIEAMRYLERALQVAATDPAGLNLFSPDLAASWLDRRPAVVALKLKRSDEALSILEENSRKLDPRLTREVVLNLTDQATAWAMRKEPQRACVTLVQAVQLAVSSGNRRGVDLARQVREQQLAKWRSDQHVRDLDEVIRVARRSI